MGMVGYIELILYENQSPECIPRNYIGGEWSDGNFHALGLKSYSYGLA
ncbi:MAG: hypothetical protein OEM98_17550 [Gammaproteobacteria bacterium]|nr:hypothetical protein [Gammaproteobacteria bacterium]